jgi:hypothetical protein
MLISLAMGVRSGPVAAELASIPSLTISQLKITSSSGQFITLYNATSNSLDMSKYQLQYFNSYDLTKATSSRLIALSGTLPPHGYYMVNDSALLLCYQLTVNSVSLGLSSTAGLIEVLAFSQGVPGGSITPVLQDYVGWSKTAATGAQTLPSNSSAWLQRQPTDTQHNSIVMSPGSGSWQTVQSDTTNACNTVTSSGTPAPVGLSQLLPSVEPLASIVDLADATIATAPSAMLPPPDIGLMAPQITELLPNPDGTGNDTTDEFIELYNPNDVSFDLSGFTLLSGLTATKTYTFPAGSSLAPRAFMAFYAEVTGLSLSNTGSLVKLFDPPGNSISSSATYSNAKDGQAWALANGKWYWTTTQTPNAANVIKQPAAKTKKLTTTTKAKTAKTTVPKVKAAKAIKTTTNSAAFADEPTTTPIHVWTLALVIGLALLYGAYEYRADMANRIYQLRRYLGARRANRR